MNNPLWLFEIAGKGVSGFYSHYAYPLLSKGYQFCLSHRLITGIIFIPWVIGASYIAFIQTPLYESHASFVIEKALLHDNNANQNVLQNLSQPNVSETYLTQSYLRSQDILSHLNKRHQLKEHYQSSSVDWFSRLEKNPSDKAFLKYYNEKITISIDDKTNALTLSVQAFSPEKAKEIATALIEESKLFINRISNEMSEKELRFAKDELNKTRNTLLILKKKALLWQDIHQMYDPKETLKSTNEVIAKLQSSLVEKQTDFIRASSFMQPHSNKLIALKEEIQALKAQIKHQTNAIVSPNQADTKLNKRITEQDWLNLKLKFAENDYESAEKAYHAASLQMAKQQNAIIEIELPSLPDDYEYPKKAYDLVNLLILLAVLCLLVKMSINIVEEHRD